MVDLTQVLLVVVITTLTILLSFIGIQVVFILREVRRTIEKVNKMIDDMGMITESIAQPIAGFGGVIDGIRSGMKAVNVISKVFHKKIDQEDQEEEQETTSKG